MYAPLAEEVTEVAVRTCWQQWQALTGDGRGRGVIPLNTIIDPEGLVLASLTLHHEEGRLRDLLLWWAGAGSHLLSVQRLRTLLRLFPAEAANGVGWFAALAVSAGDARWKRMATRSVADETARPGKGPRELQLLDPSALMFRLRAGFGVGAKADLMTFLIGAASSLGEREIWTTARVAGEAIAYSRTSVSRAASDLALARFISVSADRPPMYSLDPRLWAQVLGFREPYRGEPETTTDPTSDLAFPRWRFGVHVLAFLMASADWGRGAASGQVAPVVSASRARDIWERFGRHLAWMGIELPDARNYPGETFLEPFLELVRSVLTSMTKRLRPRP